VSIIDTLDGNRLLGLLPDIRW